MADVAGVAARVFTDPFCPWCWAAEPQLRRLQATFGEEVAITFVMAGVHRRIDDSVALATTALDAAADSGMPLDPRVFLRDPPGSSHPAGLALHAVAEQHGGARVGAYLRRLQEAVMLEGRRMDTAPALLDAAREVGGLDLARLRVDLGSSAIVERLGADLERAAAVDPRHRDPGTGRLRLPALEVSGLDGAVHGAYGPARWEAWSGAVRAAGASSGSPPGPEEALRRFGSMATAEVSAVCDMPGPRAPAELWRLALEWRVRPRRVLGGELWELA